MFRVAGILVRIHVTFLLLLAFLGYTYYRVGGTAVATSQLAFVLLLFGCVLLHEFGHAIAAKAFGIRTPDITLLPIGGVARLERMPDKPVQEMIVALAGPAVNVAIALGLFVVVGFRGAIDLQNLERGDMLVQLMVINVWLVLFNLLPAFPMDGGRVVRAVLATRMNYARATQIAATIGQGCAFIFGFWALTQGPVLLILIAIFIYIGASQEAAVAQMKDVSRGLPVSSAMVREFRTLSADAPIEDAVDALLATSQHDFPVVDRMGGVVGVLLRNDLVSALRRHGPTVRVGEVMRRGVPTVTTGTCFNEAFRMMQESGVPALPVLDPAGRLVGLLTPENVTELMMIHSALPGRKIGHVLPHAAQPHAL